MSRPPKEGEADFLSRWSRRKLDVRHAPAEAEEQAPPAPAGTDPAPEKTEAEILEELGLPDPETLGPGSDFRAFMAEAVPDFIRRKALRKLWTSNPALANLDMLVDYGEDYTDKARVVANLQSAYRAGRGYLDRLADQPEEEAAEESAAAAPAPEDAEEKPAAQPVEPPGEEADLPETAAAEDGTPEPAPTDAPSDPPADERTPVRTTLAEMPPPRRRMRFEFDD